MSAAHFSPDYSTARTRFRAAAGALGAVLESHEIGQSGPDGLPLTIDVARLGSPQPQSLLTLSSGTHGVEGYFGSAVQLALLEGRLAELALPEDHAVVLIHAINPYGFAWNRRVNEDNIDLNRNFLLEGQAFEGSPDGYAHMDPLLNPPTPPGGLEFFYPRAAFNIVRFGMPALKASVATGQYDYPRGLFYGGSGPSRSQEILRENLPRWVSGAARAVHLDFHTGMGRWGTYTLAVSEPATAPGPRFLKRHFGSHVEALDPSGVLYEIRGVLGSWLQQQVPETEYHCMLAEFGTHPVLKVVAALRNENRAHQYGVSDDASTHAAKEAMLEAFAPASEAWRTDSVSQAVTLFDQGLAALADKD